ncbi:ABC transporter, ATP-binding/permease protein [Agrococcus casei LMG 22410]|uniref:ABC transporter, ATP-binding/permease protein n=2 Tax=Agrococcus TaxID=46352 RepID=A0A1R4F422_9MICO|nr:ABC transporter, ATP-binding/permease protein [Agrococcus casei LMG 22410]
MYGIGSRSNRMLLTIQLALIALAALALSTGLVCVALFIDAVFSGDSALSGRYAIWIVVAFAVFAAADWPSEVISQNVGKEYILRIHELLANRAVELPLGFFDADRTGQLGVTATTGAVFAANAPGMMLRPIMHGATVAVVTSSYLLFIDWRIGLITLAVSIVAVISQRKLFAEYKAAEQIKAQHDQRTASQVLEFAQVQPVLRAAGSNSIGERSVRATMREQLLVLTRTQKAGQGVLARMNTILAFGVITIYAVTTTLLIAGQLTPGLFIGVIVLVFILAKLAAATIPFGEGLQLAHNTFEELRSVLDADLLPEPEAPATPADFSIEFDRVTFGYQTDDPVVRDVSFTVPSGTTTALVGPSGSGKSTLMKLAARFYDVDDGSVRIGGEDVRALGTRNVLDSIAIVFQDVYLFEDTLYENIRLGHRDASREAVLRAAEAAGVAEFAEALPQGFETIISEGGANLSGGQKQRVSIARALLKDAPVVLLDEATSSLDVTNEHHILTGLRQLAGNATTLVIAHRLHTIRDADQIVVLNPNGEVEAVGTHEELIVTNERYRGFWGERTDSSDWRISRESRSQRDL